MRLLVFGGRDFTDRTAAWRRLDQIHAETPIAMIIHGDARGADSMAREWAISRGVRHDPYPAKWDCLDGVQMDHIKRNRRGGLYNYRAGFERNEEMLRVAFPTHALGFPGGSGTFDMRNRIELARRRGQEIEWVESDYA